MILSEKAQYLKGLMDGLNIDASEPTGRVLKAMQELLEEICTTVDTIDSDVDDIVEFCETIDEDVPTSRKTFTVKTMRTTIAAAMMIATAIVIAAMTTTAASLRLYAPTAATLSSLPRKW